MKEDILQKLVDKNSIIYVLGSLLKNPLLLQNKKYVLINDDYVQVLKQLVFNYIFTFYDTSCYQFTPQAI